MKGNWKDSEVYEANQTSSTLGGELLGGLRVKVSNHHIGYKPNWVMYCYELNISGLPLRGCIGLPDAKYRSLVIVKDKLARLSTDFKDFNFTGKG